MALRRVFVDSVSDGRATASGSRAHHLARVVRLRQGEEVEVSDGIAAWVAVADVVEGKTVTFSLVKPVAPPTPLANVELHLALIKFPRLEWALEKATELGVSAIVPVIAERSDGTLAKAAPKKRERWERIVEEAAQQSRRLAPPVLTDAVPLNAALQRPADARVLIDFGGKELQLGEVPTSGTVTVLIGPEGGWTDAEIEDSSAAGAIATTLGANVLRSETAALSALSLIGLQLRTIG